MWAWVEHVYHHRHHSGLNDKTPLNRWREDLIHIRPLGIKAHSLDDIFYHRISRRIRKDGTLSFDRQWFEVPYEYAGQTIILVVDPHAKKPIRIEAKSGENLGAVTPLDEKANTHRRRQRPEKILSIPQAQSFDAVELAYQDYNHLFDISNDNKENR